MAKSLEFCERLWPSAMQAQNRVLCYSRKHNMHDCWSDERAKSCTLSLQNEITSQARNEFLETILNANPYLVSPAYLVSAAYCANFYYTALRDYSSAAKQCQMALQNVETLGNKLNKINYHFITSHFTVFITNEWSVIFDSDVQTMLGFLTLLRAVRTEEHRNKTVAIGIDSIQFLRYIHFQSVRKLKANEIVSFECNFEDAVRQLFPSLFDCEGLSKIILLTVIRLSGLTPKKLGQRSYCVQWPV